MTVNHPKEGAVYWESPVDVQLQVTVSGEYSITSPFLKPSSLPPEES